jgi:LysM repeat protein
VLGAILAAGVAFAGGRASAAVRQHGTTAHVYVVRPGDTLWGIARDQVGSAGDPRPVVQALIQRNGVVDGIITVGQRLVVPAH